MLVAAGQAASVIGDVAANVATAVRLVRLAGSQGVRLLVLPEAFLVGYDARVLADVPHAAGDLDDSTWLRPLREAVDAAGVVLLVAHPLRRPQGATMTMLEVHPGAGVRAVYDKQHPDADERVWLVAGDRPGSMLVDDVRIGLAICSDAGVAAHAALAAADGAALYVVSSAWFAGAEERRDAQPSARAVENGLAVVMAGAIGTSSDPRPFIGGSCVVARDGTPLVRLGTEEGLAVADLDLVAPMAARPQSR